ncbi:hypothetical protein SynMITS9220_02018 [Synechococcus sp. MIT S9220]|nr:hypothetical protein SynMITS9220_02018 [Synechococcus sp. MIT S9220]
MDPHHPGPAALAVGSFLLLSRVVGLEPSCFVVHGWGLTALEGSVSGPVPAGVGIQLSL